MSYDYVWPKAAFPCGSGLKLKSEEPKVETAKTLDDLIRDWHKLRDDMQHFLQLNEFVLSLLERIDQQRVQINELEQSRRGPE